MKIINRMIGTVTVLAMAFTEIPVTVNASPSISEFQSIHNKQLVSVSPESTDESNTASLLYQVEIYTNQAISDQYKERDAEGNLISTVMSDMVDTAASTLAETGENGKSIVEPIPAVTEILSNVSQYPLDEYEKEFGYNPADLDQLTYMLDFKYTATDYRVIAGEKITIGNKEEVLENGMLCASVNGGEILRSASKEDFVIVQVDSVTHKVYLFMMKEYDEKTGTYTAEFPCVGPYMITQIRK